MDFQSLRFYVKTRRILNVSAIEIFNELKSAYDSQAPSYEFVLKWVHLFETGRENIEDDPRSGRPTTSLTTENIELVREIIEGNPYVTYNEIEALTSLYPPTIHSIIHEHLHLRKVTSRFVPHFLSEKNKKERVRICQENLAKLKDGSWRLYDIITGDESWFYHRHISHKQSNASWIGKEEDPRTVVRQGKFEPKTLFSIFFRTTGVVHISYIDRGKIIDSNSYIEDCLKPMFKDFMKQRPKSGLKNVKFHHDNAKPHVAQSVINYLNEQKVIIMEHPPYSPDLAPSDFWLFDYVKKQLDNHTDAESLNSQITKILKNTPGREFLKTFHMWIERMELCIKSGGEYFEHSSL